MDKESNYMLVGKSVPRVDAREKVLGSAIYGADFKLPGMLCGKVLTSGHAHAKITHIDSTRASRLTGVRAVLTGKEVGLIFGDFIKDQPILAKDKVRYAGDAVAAVAAIDEETAEEALELIKIEYEELPPVLDAVAAMNAHAPLVY